MHDLLGSLAERGNTRTYGYCKRTDGCIPVKDIRSFLSVLSDGDVGLFVALGGFTQEAENKARHQEKRWIMLLDPSDCSTSG
jgi:hypothetical protein